MSEKYIVSARKYRPSSFATVVGQQALTHTLQTAIASDRLAHAYLFCGPRGVGKTTCARIFAKTINCEHRSADGEACNECPSCQAFNSQRSFNVTELDAASNNSVDDIRNITDEVRIPPQTGRYRVFIIDEVHMLSTAAFNAFLKTLEEPPEYAIFILATTEKQKVIPTILSRCQIYDFARITVPDIVRQLQYVCSQEGVEAEPAALNVIAQKADGAMRDALSIFDQVVASSQGHVTYKATIDNLNVLDYDYYFRLVDTFLAGDVQQALLIYKEIRDNGFDSQFFINGLAQHLRDLMVASSATTHNLLEMNEEVAQRYQQQSALLQPAYYYHALDLCSSCDLNYRNAGSKQLLVELTLIKLCQLAHPELTRQKAPTQPLRKVTPAATTQAPQRQPAQAQQPAPLPQQPAQSQQPAQQQSATPAAPARPQPRVGERVMIHATTRPEAAAQPSAPAERRATPFTMEQFQQQWQRYITEHPRHKLVVTSMLTAKINRVDDNTLQVMVPSKGDVTFMEDAKGELMKALRDGLQNDLLTLNFDIDPTIKTRKIKTPREVVEDMKRDNPGLSDFIDKFHLGLA